MLLCIWIMVRGVLRAQNCLNSVEAFELPFVCFIPSGQMHVFSCLFFLAVFLPSSFKYICLS